MAPMSSSSACAVRVVVPESGCAGSVPVPVVVDPIVGLTLSFGVGDMGALNEKKLAHMFPFIPVGRLIVIVPVKVAVYRRENTRVRTPVVTEPFVTSASLVYALLALSLTVTTSVDGSMAI